MYLLFSMLIFLISCGNPITSKFSSTVDGDRPLQLVLTTRLIESSKTLGSRYELLTKALPIVNNMWNPNAKGDLQIITIDIDDNDIYLDDGVGPCIKNGFALWSIPGQPNIFICPLQNSKGWIFCVNENDKTLYGEQGCILGLAHELGHVLGATKHIPQNGRNLHNSGPIICTWESDCTNYLLKDYTKEDEDLICNDGGIGGRCETKLQVKEISLTKIVGD